MTRQAKDGTRCLKWMEHGPVSGGYLSFLLFFFYDLRRLHVVLSFSYFEGRKNLFGARDVCNDFLSNNGNPACDTSAMANTVRMLRTIDYDAVNGLKVSTAVQRVLSKRKQSAVQNYRSILPAYISGYYTHWSESGALGSVLRNERPTLEKHVRKVRYLET